MEVIGILIMKQDLLAKHIKEGLLYFREVSELPEWLLPGMSEVAARLGDKKILDLTADHKIKEEAEQLIKQTETAIIPAESWRQGIAQWPAVDQVRPVVLALLRARDKIDALLRQGNKEANSFSMVRSLCTLAYAPFISDGAKILDSLANILGGSPGEPAILLNRYMESVASGDKDTLTHIDECILSDPFWKEWFDKLANTGKAFPFVPRVIGINPVSSPELIRLLATMIKEVNNADSNRNNAN